MSDAAICRRDPCRSRCSVSTSRCAPSTSTRRRCEPQEAGSCVIALGPPGVGKSHLAIAPGVAATEAGYLTFFTYAADMVASLQQAHLESTALYKFRTYVGPSVLVVDELGYLPLDQQSANWIFQVVSRPTEPAKHASSASTRWGWSSASANTARTWLEWLRGRPAGARPHHGGPQGAPPQSN
jgi:DNA replication protein DnaC